MRTLLWLQNDLRLHDNAALHASLDASELLIVTFWPNPKPWCNNTGMGPQRQRFLAESLQGLNHELTPLGQTLHVSKASPENVLPELVERYEIDRIITSQPQAYNEAQTLEYLERTLDCPLLVTRGNTLFDEAQFPFQLDAMPKYFTPFKQQIKHCSAGETLPTPTHLPPPIPKVRYGLAPKAVARPHLTLPFRGGESEGLRRLKHWIFDRQAVVHYKQTRNALDGLDNCSIFSPWLAIGALSVRHVAEQLARFEQEYLSNESTEWFLFELWWREFFHWRAQVDGLQLFLPYGVARQKRLRTFEPRQYARWCQGDTDYPLVNALMHQLVVTGYMSNRGRQIAASCLVNELGVDWRYGAAFFEKYLIDYDVGSNYGNWQYIAGVGSDPRGGRQFNIEKQTAQHDPDGRFTRQWDGFRAKQPLYVTDASDWPIG